MARCCQQQHPQLILHVSMQDIAGLPTFVQAGVKAVHADHVELDRATTLQLDQTIPRNTVQPASSKLRMTTWSSALVRLLQLVAASAEHVF